VHSGIDMEASSGIAVRCELACRRAGGNGAENREVKLWYAAGRGELDPYSYLLGFGDAPASKKHCVMMNLPWYTCTTAHGCGMAQPHRRRTETLSFAARPGQRMRQGVRVCCWGPTALAYRAHVWHSTGTLLVRVSGVRSRTRFSLHDIRMLLQGRDPCRHNGSLWSEPFYREGCLSGARKRTSSSIGQNLRNQARFLDLLPLFPRPSIAFFAVPSLRSTTSASPVGCTSTSLRHTSRSFHLVSKRSTLHMGPRSCDHVGLGSVFMPTTMMNGMNP